MKSSEQNWDTAGRREHKEHPLRSLRLCGEVPCD
jgi:hypothetical protein